MPTKKQMVPRIRSLRVNNVKVRLHPMVKHSPVRNNVFPIAISLDSEGSQTNKRVREKRKWLTRHPRKARLLARQNLDQDKSSLLLSFDCHPIPWFITELLLLLGYMWGFEGEGVTVCVRFPSSNRYSHSQVSHVTSDKWCKWPATSGTCKWQVTSDKWQVTSDKKRQLEYSRTLQEHVLQNSLLPVTQLSLCLFSQISLFTKLIKIVKMSLL